MEEFLPISGIIERDIIKNETCENQNLFQTHGFYIKKTENKKV